MTSCEPKSWLLTAAATLWAVIEFWLGRTDKVRAGSVLEAILNGLRHIVLVLIVGFALLFTGYFRKPENEDEHQRND